MWARVAAPDHWVHRGDRRRHPCRRQQLQPYGRVHCIADVNAVRWTTTMHTDIHHPHARTSLSISAQLVTQSACTCDDANDAAIAAATRAVLAS